jgi:hypothetical protein
MKGRLSFASPKAATTPAISSSAGERGRREASSPIRGSGTPPRDGPRRRLVWDTESHRPRRGRVRGGHVASLDSWRMQAEPGGIRADPWRPQAVPTPGKPKSPELQGEEGAIEEFFGQL